MRLNTDTYIKFLQALREKSASTQHVYTAAVLKFYKFNRAGDLIELQEATQCHRHKTQNKVVRFDHGAVEKVITHCESLRPDSSSALKTLENLRDRALVLTLADTGLKISEACALKLGDMDWKEQRAILGQENNDAVVRFSRRAVRALTEYLEARASVVQNSQVPYAAQPLFAPHDRSASKKMRPITTSRRPLPHPSHPARDRRVLHLTVNRTLRCAAPEYPDRSPPGWAHALPFPHPLAFPASPG